MTTTSMSLIYTSKPSHVEPTISKLVSIEILPLIHRLTLSDSQQRAQTLPTSSHDEYLSFVSSYIDDLSKILRPISLKIHDNPELNFEEFIAHETLTTFLKTRKGWKVTPSAYGIKTAFVAEYDSGKPGAVVSYNAEYGKTSFTLLIFLEGKALTDKPNRCTQRNRPFLRPQPNSNLLRSSSSSSGRCNLPLLSSRQSRALRHTRRRRRWR